MLAIRPVSRADVDAVLPFVFRYIEEALYHDNMEGAVENIALELMDGDLTLWLVYDSNQLKGCVTTGFVAYAYKLSMELRTVTIHAPRDEWLPLFETLEAYAQKHGCYDIECTGRLGLEKLTPAVGFKKTHVKMTKRVRYEQQA